MNTIEIIFNLAPRHFGKWYSECYPEIIQTIIRIRERYEVVLID